MPDNELDGFFGKIKERSAAAPRGPRRTAKTFQADLPVVDAIDFDASMDRAREAFEKARDQLVSRQQKRHNQRKSTRMTKKALTEKVRGEIKAGKLPKGSLKTTVDKRWKANQSRQVRNDKKFQEGLNQQIEDLRKQFFPDGGPAEQFQVLEDKWKYTVEATVGISDDVRVISVSFTGNTGDDLEAQTFLAAAEYFQDDRIDLEDWEVTSKDAAE